MLPDKIRLLEVSVGDIEHAGQLLKTSTYEFRYLQPNPEQPAAMASADWATACLSNPAPRRRGR